MARQVTLMAHFPSTSLESIILLHFCVLGKQDFISMQSTVSLGNLWQNLLCFRRYKYDHFFNIVNIG